MNTVKFNNNIFPKLIVLGGRKRSGKGTASQWFVQNHGYVEIKFADTLKAMLRVLLEAWGLDDVTIHRLIEGDLKELPLPTYEVTDVLPASLLNVKMGGKSVRHAMQTLGTEWRETIYQNLWVEITRRKIITLWSQNKNVIIEDMRFIHEYDLMNELGAYKIKITNNRLPIQNDIHISEQDLPDCLYTIIVANNNSIEDLNAIFENIFSKYA